MSKKKQDIIVSFEDSESTNGVTGSCVKVNDNILLECGLMQGKGGPIESYKINNANFKFKTKDIDYVFLMHNHIDHSGLLGKLYKRGCDGQLIIPKGSKEILEKLLLNCAFILESEAKYVHKKSKNTKECLPIYTEEDVKKVIEHAVEFEVNELHYLDANTRFTFIHSGHITGSCSLVLELKDGNNWSKLLYTSDLGNSIYKQYYVEPMETIGSCDIVISEATYGSKEQSNEREDERDRDIERIKSVVEQSKNVLIPSFSYGRSQTILTMLYEIYKDLDLKHEIYVDSVLLNEINEIYRNKFPEFAKVLDWEKVHLIGRNERKDLFNSKKEKIIVASSGMLQGNSASVSWLSHLIEKSYNTVLFCGYISESSIGRKIKDVKQKTITISGTVRKNKCNVAVLKSMSGHIQFGRLLQYLGNINCKKVILHHGSKENKINIKKHLEKIYEDKCQSTRIIIPDKKTKVKIK